MIITYLSNYSIVRFGSSNYREYVNVSQLSIERLKRVLERTWRRGECTPGWVQGGCTWVVRRDRRQAMSMCLVCGVDKDWTDGKWQCEDGCDDNVRKARRCVDVQHHCGHPIVCIVTEDDGASYCEWCAELEGYEALKIHHSDHHVELDEAIAVFQQELDDKKWDSE